MDIDEQVSITTIQHGFGYKIQLGNDLDWDTPATEDRDEDPSEWSYFILYTELVNATDIIRKHIVEDPSFTYFFDATFYNGTHYIGLEGTPYTVYGTVTRLPDNKQWLWLVKDLYGDGYVHLKFFPIYSVVRFKNPDTGNILYEYTITGSYNDAGLVEDYPVSIPSGNYDVEVIIKKIVITSVQPTMIRVGVNYPINIYVKLFNSLISDGSYVDVILYDDDGNVRDTKQNVFISYLSNNTVQLTTLANENDLGYHTWKIVVRDTNGVYDYDTLEVSIYIELYSTEDYLIDKYSDYVIVYFENITYREILMKWATFIPELDTYIAVKEIIAFICYGDYGADIELTNGTILYNVKFYDKEINGSLDVYDIEFFSDTLFIFDGYVYGKLQFYAYDFLISFDWRVNSTHNPNEFNYLPSVVVYFDELRYNEYYYNLGYNDNDFGDYDLNSNGVQDDYYYTIDCIEYRDLRYCLLEADHCVHSRHGLVTFSFGTDFQWNFSNGQYEKYMHIYYIQHNLSNPNVSLVTYVDYLVPYNTSKINVTIYYLDDDYIADVFVNNQTVKSMFIDQESIKRYIMAYYRAQRIKAKTFDVNKYSKLPEWHDVIGWKDYIMGLFADIWGFASSLMTLFGSFMQFTMGILPNVAQYFSYITLFLTLAFITLAIYNPAKLYEFIIWLTFTTKKVLEFIYMLIMKLVSVIAKLLDLTTGPIT